jgi:hypothetical protein
MRTIYLLLTVLLMLTFGHTGALAGDSGDAGALFLRIGMGGRASAMGEAFTAVAADASALYWNPGAMAPVLGTNGLAMHNEYFQSLRLEQLALTQETDYGTLGLGFTGLYMDPLERREDVPSAIPLGTFSAYDVAVTVGFARYIYPNLSVGLAVKPVYQKIDETSATGVAFDLGLYHIARIKGVKFAAVIANVGKPMKFEAEEYALPRTIKIGASYERAVPRLRGDLLFTADAVAPNDGELREHFGLEYAYLDRLFIRGGYKAGYDCYGLTAGLGVEYQKLHLDYAVLFIDNDLGDSHRISLAFSL